VLGVLAYYFAYWFSRCRLYYRARNFRNTVFAREVFKLAAAVRRAPRISAIGPLKANRQCSNLSAWLCTSGVPKLLCAIVHHMGNELFFF